MEEEESYIEVRDNVRDALIDSTIGLFGIYKNKQGKEFICHNGGKFQSIE
jgi:hypothetical protein